MQWLLAAVVTIPPPLARRTVWAMDNFLSLLSDK